MDVTQVQEAIDLIRMEYAEMPEQQLTFWQAQRLWNLSTELCERALTALTRSGFLVCTREGAYIRGRERLIKTTNRFILRLQPRPDLRSRHLTPADRSRAHGLVPVSEPRPAATPCTETRREGFRWA